MDSLVSTYTNAFTGLISTMKVFVLFNKISGAYVQWINWHEPHGIDPNIFDFAVVEEFNPNLQAIVGTFSNFEVVNKVDQPQPVTEGLVNAMTEEEITQRYPIPKQLNTIAAALVVLSKHLQLEEAPEVAALIEQVETIKELLKVGSLRKEGYQQDDSFAYMSDESKRETELAIFEGGLGETVGPRQVILGN